MTNAEVFLNLAGGDPALARAVRSSLDQLADGKAGARLQEMARDVVAGKLDLRLLATSSVYAEDVTHQLSQLARRRAELGDAEFERQASQVSEAMTAASDEINKRA